MIGHTPRKLPPLGAIARFIALYTAPGVQHPSHAYLNIIKEIPLFVKGDFHTFRRKFCYISGQSVTGTSSPNSPGMKRGQTFSSVQIVAAARRVPMAQASCIPLP